jgi:hypothetical protein
LPLAAGAFFYTIASRTNKHALFMLGLMRQAIDVLWHCRTRFHTPKRVELSTHTALHQPRMRGHAWLSSTHPSTTRPPTRPHESHSSMHPHASTRVHIHPHTSTHVRTHPHPPYARPTTQKVHPLEIIVASTRPSTPHTSTATHTRPQPPTHVHIHPHTSTSTPHPPHTHPRRDAISPRSAITAAG